MYHSLSLHAERGKHINTLEEQQQALLATRGNLKQEQSRVSDELNVLTVSLNTLKFEGEGLQENIYALNRTLVSMGMKQVCYN